jgi:hypothetical protein
MKYSNRIMFGTDEGASEAMYQNYFRWLETEDEYFHAQYPLQGRGFAVWVCPMTCCKRSITATPRRGFREKAID